MERERSLTTGRKIIVEGGRDAVAPNGLLGRDPKKGRKGGRCARRGSFSHIVAGEGEMPACELPFNVGKDVAGRG